MEWMLKYNPRDRPKAHQVLTHEFFAGKVSSNLPTVLSSKDGEETQQTSATSKPVESLIISENGLKINAKGLKVMSDAKSRTIEVQDRSQASTNQVFATPKENIIKN